MAKVIVSDYTLTPGWRRLTLDGFEVVEVSRLSSVYNATRAVALYGSDLDGVTVDGNAFVFPAGSPLASWGATDVLRIYYDDPDAQVPGGGSGGSPGGPVTWESILGKPAVIAAGTTPGQARSAIGAASTADIDAINALLGELGADHLTDATETGRALLRAPSPAAARSSLQVPSTGEVEAAIAEALAGALPGELDGFYTLPESGIPATDLAADVRDALERATTALQAVAADDIVDATEIGRALLRAADAGAARRLMEVPFTDPATAVPTLWIEAEDGVSEPVDKVAYVRCTYRFSTGETYTGRFRGRGNSTWGLPKKPWKVKFDDRVGPLGLAPSKDFCLLANYLDPTFLRNSIYFHLSELLGGYPFVPQGRHVRVCVNGEYRGLYWFGQDVRMEPHRLDYEEAGTAGPELTGAYLMEIDRRAVGSGETHFVTTEGVVVALNEPDGTDDPAQLAYISEWVQQFEDALMGPDWLDPELGYRRYIDMPSFATWYLVNELIANLDSDFFSSVKLLKTRDTDTEPGRLYMAAPWDADQSILTWIPAYEMYTLARTNGHDETYSGAVWLRRMVDDPQFRDELMRQWSVLHAYVKGGGLEAWLRTASRALSDERNSDQWIWTTQPPRTTDLVHQQRLLSYLQQRANLIQAFFVDGPDVYDWEIVTSETFSAPGSGSLVGRTTDAALGGDPLPWSVSSAEDHWRIHPDGGAGWTVEQEGNIAAFGLQIDGPMEVEFDKFPHADGTIRVALGADSLSAEAIFGIALDFTPWGVSASFPPASWAPGTNTEVDTRPIWSDQVHRVRVRLHDNLATVWIDGTLVWQADQCSRAGDWLFFERSATTRTPGSFIDNIVIRYLPVVIGGEAEWLTFVSDTFSGSGGAIGGRISDAVLGGAPQQWVASNSDSGWIYSDGRMGLSGDGYAQAVGFQVEGPVEIKFRLVDLPVDDDVLVTIKPRTNGLNSEVGVGITLSKWWMAVGYNGSEGWTSTYINEPETGWDGSDWRISLDGNTMRVFIDNALVFEAFDVPSDGPWTTFRKDTNDTVEQFLFRNLQIRQKSEKMRNRHPNPGLELNDWNWGGYGGTIGRSDQAAHTGAYGWRAEWGGGSGELSFWLQDSDFGGQRFAGSVWLRCNHDREVMLRVDFCDASWNLIEQGPSMVVALQADTWRQVALPSAASIPEGTGVIKVGVWEADSTGWQPGQVLDADDLVMRVWK